MTPSDLPLPDGLAEVARPGDAHLRQLLLENSQDVRAVLNEIVQATADLRGELRRHRRTVYRRWIFRFVFGLAIGIAIGVQIGLLAAR
ncbi:MAG: hypothetical protein OXH05_04705 [Acidobacteria bacterium]|nr:hypothetical protein [Acidobacteriota bacterium]